MESLEQRVEPTRWENFKASAKRVAVGVALGASLLSGAFAAYCVYNEKVVVIPKSPFEYRLEYKKEVLPNGVITEEKNVYERSQKMRIEIVVPKELQGKVAPGYRPL